MKTSFFIFCILMYLSSSAQIYNYNYNWLFGYVGSSPDSNSTLYALNKLDFQSGQLKVSREFRPSTLSYGGIVANDKFGRMVFYCDGFTIYNSNDQILNNGSGLNPGPVADQFQEYNLGYPDPPSGMILPCPDKASLYYMFHSGIQYDTLGQLGSFVSRSYYSVIDISANNSVGEVTDKNHVLVLDTIMGASGRAACKHANGRDWWIITQEINSNCFYKFLLTPNGVDTFAKQCIGDSIHKKTDRGSNCFSPDGSIYAWSNPHEGLGILKFDRCSGRFTNFLRIPIQDSFTQATGVPLVDGISISPNSRFLYLSTGTEIRQFDLQNNDIPSTEVIIENTLNGLPRSSTQYMQLGSDGRIYISSGTQDTFLHIIAKPDLPGLNCDYRRNAILLPSWNLSCLPYYPNYSLGCLEGSVCDTLRSCNFTMTTEEEEATFGTRGFIYPNPSTGKVTLNLNEALKGDGEVKVYNIQGNLLETISLMKNQDSWVFNLQGYDNSMLIFHLYINRILTASFRVLITE